jgi:ferredoxin-NADP reductase
MDRDRRGEIRNTLLGLGQKHGFAEVVPESGRIDWDQVFDVATEANRRLAPRIGAFRDRYQRAHPALISITLELDNPVDFAAGQYVSLRFNGRTRPYSVASSPNRDELELCVRRVPDGRLSPKLCDSLSVGDEVTVRGPNGHLLLESQSERDLAFLATGTGVAPMKSMIDYLFEEGRDENNGHSRDVWLFLGAAWEDDLPYHDEFVQRATSIDNFHYIPCLSRETWLSGWDGETDYIQDAMLKYVEEQALDDAAFGRHIAKLLSTRPDVDVDANIDPSQLEVYACGINAMVYSLEMAMKKLGVPDHHVHCEGYG